MRSAVVAAAVAVAAVVAAVAAAAAATAVTEAAVFRRLIMSRALQASETAVSTMKAWDQSIDRTSPFPGPRFMMPYITLTTGDASRLTNIVTCRMIRRTVVRYRVVRYVEQ